MAAETKRDRLLAYLKTHRDGLTGLEMVTLFGLLNYKNDIYVLRNKGVPIADAWEEKLDDRGRVLERWKRYYIPAMK